MTLSLIKKEERKRETLLARAASTEMVVQMLGRGRYTDEFIARFCDVPVGVVRAFATKYESEIKHVRKETKRMDEVAERLIRKRMGRPATDGEIIRRLKRAMEG